MSHISITDHGTLSGHRNMQTAAKEAGLVPILGLEAYISPTDRFDKRTNAKRTDGTSVYNHLILLATGEVGIKNLNRLSEIGWNEGFYNKPRIDFEVLSENKDGLIVLSGCLGGLISKAIERGDVEEAERWAQQFKSEFGDSFYIEVQSENPVEINTGLLSIADKFNIPAVITGDCHYADPKDRWVEEAFLILSTNPKQDRTADYSKSQKMDMLERFNYLYPDRRMTFQDWDLFLAGREHRFEKMNAMGIDRHDIFDNTNIIANRIGDYPYYKDLSLLPIPKAADPFERLSFLCKEGMKHREVRGLPGYEERLAHELEVVKSKGFASYFLILTNMLNWARSKDIWIGPGRGSAAGSLVCYVLGITQVDPIEFDLLFARFLDESRSDWPDIDVDVQDNRRGELKEYARKQFKHVASITTVNILQEKAAIKAASRVFGINFSEANKATKNLDTKNAFAEYVKDSNSFAFHKKYPEVLDLAKRIEGRIAGYGMHAGGLVVSKEPISNYVPMETRSDKDNDVSGRIAVVGYDMNDIAEIGLIKYDLLGLKAGSIIKDCIVKIKERHGIDITLPTKKKDFNDWRTFDMLAQGYTKGVFQAEQPAMTSLMIKLGVNDFEDIVVANALVRPGAMNIFGQDYIACKKGKKFAVSIHETIDGYMANTYYMPIYQEQSMQICAELAGLGMAVANKIRKVTAKKQDPVLLAEYKETFIEGSKDKVGELKAKFLWDSIEETASYQFNRSHSVAYSMITYWTAWLKVNYPLEFMYAVLKNEKDKDSLTDYLIEAKRLGIKVKLPHVNYSELGFSIEGDAIRFGLKNVKYISDNTGNRLIAARPFANYHELKTKVEEKGSGLTSRVLSSLNAIGGAYFVDNPRTGKERENLYEFLNIPAFEGIDLPPKVKLQFTPLDEYSETEVFPILAMVRKIVRGDGWSRVEVVDETGSSGIFAGENTPIEPGQMYAMLVAQNRVARFVVMDELLEKTDNTFVDYLYADGYPDIPPGMFKVLAFQKRTTKAGKQMAHLVICDESKEAMPVLVFPQMFIKAWSKCKDGAVIGAELRTLDDGTVILNNIY